MATAVYRSVCEPGTLICCLEVKICCLYVLLVISYPCVRTRYIIPHFWLALLHTFYTTLRSPYTLTTYFFSSLLLRPFCSPFLPSFFPLSSPFFLYPHNRFSVSRAWEYTGRSSERTVTIRVQPFYNGSRWETREGEMRDGEMRERERREKRKGEEAEGG